MTKLFIGKPVRLIIPLLNKRGGLTMRKMMNLMMKLASSAVFFVAISTVASTSRYLAYQPETDEAVMKKYLEKH